MNPHSVYEEESSLRDALSVWRPAPDMEPMDLMYEAREFASAEGYCYSYVRLGDLAPSDFLGPDAPQTQVELDSLVASSTGTAQRFVQQDFVAARDVGLGGHRPAAEYFEHLLQLPPDPQEWTSTQFAAAEVILAKCRHLFFLAQEARWQRPLTSDSEFANVHRELQLYFAARTLAAGPMLDGAGREVLLPEAKVWRETEFEELQWPRHSEHLTQDGESLFICRRDPFDKGYFEDLHNDTYHCNHAFEFFWSGLLCISYVERMGNEELRRNELENES